jgi:hypothetical protein
MIKAVSIPESAELASALSSPSALAISRAGGKLYLLAHGAVLSIIKPDYFVGVSARIGHRMGAA